MRDFPDEFPIFRTFDCEDGWYVLIDVLCERLQDETDTNGAPQIVVNQIKQKFGEEVAMQEWMGVRKRAS